MDGNNRWSKKNNKKKYYAYKKGASTLINLTNSIFDKTNAKSMNWVKSFFIKNDGTPNNYFLLLYLEALKKYHLIII